jgi:UDP-N-acetylmuramate--alanine ligase
MGLPLPKILEALKNFRPAKRRFEIMARARGITVISDYAHHPTEIRALMQQASSLNGRRIVAVFQPHRYSRTRAMGPEIASAFDGVDELVVVPVYAASEQPVAGGTTLDLVKHFERAHYEDSLPGAWRHLQETLRDGDVLLVVGAGDVEKIAFWAQEDLQRIP